MTPAEREEAARRAQEFRQTRGAYIEVLGPDDQARQLIWKDLADFCGANDSIYAQDARQHALFEGRREVYLRIRDWVTVDPEKLWLKQERVVLRGPEGQPVRMPLAYAETRRQDDELDPIDDFMRQVISDE